MFFFLALLRLKHELIVCPSRSRVPHSSVPSLLHEHVPAAGPFDVVGDGLIFFVLAAVDQIGRFDAFHGTIGGNGDHIQFVDFPELRGFGHGRTGHAREFVVELEEILQRNRGEGLRLFLDRDAFFGLHGLVQAVAPLTTFHQAARELVDDDHAAFLDDVVNIAFVEIVRLERIVDQMRPLHVAGGVEALDAGQLFRFAHAFIGQTDVVVFLVDFKMNVGSSVAGRLGRHPRICECCRAPVRK